MAKSDKASKEEMEKAAHLKRSIEKIMGGRLKATRDRKKRDIQLEAKLNEKDMSTDERRQMQISHFLEESQGLRAQRAARKKMTAKDFEIVSVIGKGAFGEVRIVKDKRDEEGRGKVYAMKTMIKSMMVAKNQLGHIVAERDLMAESDNPWLVKLFWAFQDQTYLYLVMEYCGGGDLMGLLIKKDILSEKDTRFYMSELACAINYVHKLGYVHRDLKPDNVLIGNGGHIRLSDFGLAKSFESANDKNLGNWQKYVATLRKEDLEKAKEEEESGKHAHPTRKKLYSTVGTPDYIAIEVLYQKGYDKYVDWWSMGVIMFECLVGYAPFHAKDPLATCRKIVRYERYFKVPSDVKLSRPAMDLMKRLVCPAHRRLGWEQITRHPWFKKVPWADLRSVSPAFVPKLKSAVDASYFDSIEAEQDISKAPEPAPYTGVDNRVWGYTFNHTTAEAYKSYEKSADKPDVAKGKGGKAKGKSGKGKK